MNLSKRSVQRYLNEIGYKYVGNKIKPKNDIDDQEIRLNWCNRHVFDNWNNIFFTDERTIYLNNPGGFKWIKEDIQRNVITGRNRGRKVNVWGAINWKWKWTLHIFEENLYTEMYLTILTDMLPEMRSITDENIVIQMNNARVHWSINSLKFYRENKIRVIDWHPNSPDLNPIENLWCFLKKQIRRSKIYKKSADIKNSFNMGKHRRRTNQKDMTIYL